MQIMEHRLLKPSLVNRLVVSSEIVTCIKREELRTRLPLDAGRGGEGDSFSEKQCSPTTTKGRQHSKQGGAPVIDPRSMRADDHPLSGEKVAKREDKDVTFLKRDSGRPGSFISFDRLQGKIVPDEDFISFGVNLGKWFCLQT
ncbi:hypothetical protein CEXT_269021 [Caerostris extrusa]|uniref:Uncharacterized protein n=1 Tax=Caerostris extrusa TaxID=172846 RepID=A0AAV4R497_CAEEX|nr:hypothetical protein CEXT_269021 [Caerostris extrusa]